ncbi:MAG: thioredoxin family protein [Phycisphaerales bacterium]|jgi:peroxiredoxin
MKAKQMITALTVGFAALALAGAPAMAQSAKPTEQPAADHGKDHKAKDHKMTKDATKDAGKGVDVGQTAPDFKLKDTDGKEVTLSEYTKAGKTVVLFWFNPSCPYVVKHFNGDQKTFNDLAAKYKDKNVQVIAINSGAPGNEGAGLEANAKAKKDWKIGFPILLDESGTVGKEYGAKNTPFTLVITKEGKVAYEGAIDDDSTAGKPGKTNYAAKALDEVLAGTSVTTAKTKPYGCSVKYGKN